MQSASATRNPFVLLLRYLRESKSELGKVTWPSRQETIRYSLLVIGISAGVGLFFASLDWVLNLGLEALIRVSAV